MNTDHDRLLTPGEVAVMFRVDPKTVTRWAQAGRLPFIRTLGGHRRFRLSEVRGLMTSAADHGGPAQTSSRDGGTILPYDRTG